MQSSCTHFGSKHMGFEDFDEEEKLDPELEAEIDVALERAQLAPEPPYVLEAVFHPEPELQFLMLKLSTGRRLLIPREELLALRNATDEQAQDIRILSSATTIYWPQLDDGLHVPEFLEHDWHPLDERLAKPGVQSTSPTAEPIAA